MVNANTIQSLADRTTAEGLLFVKARRFAELLWSNGEQYHAGAIDHAAFATTNVRIWSEIKSAGVTKDVKFILRQR
jgi:hypothetical protein